MHKDICHAAAIPQVKAEIFFGLSCPSGIMIEQEAVAYAFTACEFTLNCWPFGPVGAYHREGKGY